MKKNGQEKQPKGHVHVPGGVRAVPNMSEGGPVIVPGGVSVPVPEKGNVIIPPRESPHTSNIAGGSKKGGRSSSR